MWLIAGVVGLLVLVVLLDLGFRRGFRSWHVPVALAVLGLSLMFTVAAAVIHPTVILGALLALVCANAFIAYQRSRAFREVAALGSSGSEPSAESPYEQFVNVCLGHFDRGEADGMEFLFRNWRMEIRFTKGGTPLPVIDTPFHILLQIKRLFDAATVKNPKSGDSKLRYVARGVLYEFLSEDEGGTLLRLKLLHRREATAAESTAFDRLLVSVR